MEVVFRVGAGEGDEAAGGKVGVACCWGSVRGGVETWTGLLAGGTYTVCFASE